MPLFAAKMLTGSMSGFLLAAYCPAHVFGKPAPPCNGAAMWGVIGATTISSAVLLGAVRRYVTVQLDIGADGGAEGKGAYVRLNEGDATDLELEDVRAALAPPAPTGPTGDALAGAAALGLGTQPGGL